jgi:hypothetical protein
MTHVHALPTPNGYAQIRESPAEDLLTLAFAPALAVRLADLELQ